MKETSKGIVRNNIRIVGSCFFDSTPSRPSLLSSSSSDQMAPAATCRLLTLLFSIATILSVPVAARPCKTLFITSYSFTLTKHPRFDANPNPNPGFNPQFVTIFTATSTLSRFHPRHSLYLVDRRYFPSGEIERPKSDQQRVQPQSSLGFGLFDVSSLRDRTKDILSVVVALLFGVGCGALTAATMYLAWSVFANDRVEDSESDGDYDAIESPKKMGYVTIPTADSVPGPTKA